MSAKADYSQWWHMPAIPALEKLRHEGESELEVGAGLQKGGKTS